MPNFIVLATAPDLIESSKQILVDGGAELHFMPAPVTEDSLIQAFSRIPVEAVFMSGSPPFTERVLQAAPHLRIIAKRGAGVDSVDMVAATKRRVTVTIAAGANANAVAEHALTMMLSLVRELRGWESDLQKRLWRDSRAAVREFSEIRVGVVGFGAIGRRTAELAQACGAKVVIHTRSPVPCPTGMELDYDFNRFIRNVDILSLHCPLNKTTRNMIGKKELSLMKSGAIFINTARGGLVDETALALALTNGRLAGAGLDTFAVEPIVPSNPLIGLNNVICTPHSAGITNNATTRVCDSAATNIVKYFKNIPLDNGCAVNPETLSNS